MPPAACDFKFYRLAGNCEKCPNLAWLTVLGFLLVIVVVALFAYYTHRKKINLVGLAIGVDFMQVISMFVAFDFNWPTPLKRYVATRVSYAVRRVVVWCVAARAERFGRCYRRCSMYTSSSTFSLNLELVAPECSFTASYDQKFFVIESIPLVIVGVCMLVAIGLILDPIIRSYFARRRGRALASRASADVAAVPQTLRESIIAMRPKFDMLLGVMFTGMFYVYFIVVKTALGIFDCNDNGTGVSVLDGNPNVVCERDKSPYGTVYPYGILGLSVYGIGVPLAFGVVLFKYRAAIRSDQQLKVKGEGMTLASNPNLWVRRRYGKLYEDFRPEAAWWRMVLMTRKFMLAWATIMFNDNPTFQVRACIPACVCAYMHACACACACACECVSVSLGVVTLEWLRRLPRRRRSPSSCCTSATCCTRTSTRSFRDAKCRCWSWT